MVAKSGKKNCTDEVTDKILSLRVEFPMLQDIDWRNALMRAAARAQLRIKGRTDAEAANNMNVAMIRERGLALGDGS